MSRIIINRGQNISTINNKFEKTSYLLTLVNKALKINKARLLTDTEQTLIYRISH